jgi:hypothetical protein
LKEGGIFYSFIEELGNALCPNTVDWDGEPIALAYIGSVGTNLFIHAN